MDRRTKALAAVALAAACGVAVALFGLSLTPDRYLLVLLVPALAIGRARRYILDFVPFTALILVYAECRGIAHLIRPHPYYFPQIRMERFLFGGHLPTVDLQRWLYHGGWRWYDRASLEMTRIHFIVPPLLGFALWIRRRALFYRFAATMLLLSFAAAISFAIVPAAPPWAASGQGAIPTVVRLAGAHSTTSSPGGLGSYSVSHLIDPNPYAAIPSLHAGYAFLAFLFVLTLAWGTRWRWLALLGIVYPLLQFFAVVYTANHYVVDLLIGCAYAAASLVAVRWFWRRHGLPE